MVSSLISYFGLSNIAVAEDLVQETFATALEQWKDGNIPDDPKAWLFRVCKNKTINHVKRHGTRVQLSTDEQTPSTSSERDFFLDHEIPDYQLRLLFACCDNRLSPRSQVMLILKNVCGLRVSEIASGLLMNEEAVTKALTRSRTILSDGEALSIPSIHQCSERINVIHTALYLLFTEGYSASDNDTVIRRELCIEAMRLVKAILEIEELRTFDTFALMALMCFHSSRFDARTGASGELIELENQDRNLWDKELIRLGVWYLQKAYGTTEPSRFVYEAAIASLHSVAEKFGDTNWEAITGLYDRLLEIQSNPVIELNRAVAVLHAQGPRRALEEIETSKHLVWMKQSYIYYALLGKIFKEIGNSLDALRNYEKALNLCKLRAEKEFFKSKIMTLQAMMN